MNSADVTELVRLQEDTEQKAATSQDCDQIVEGSVPPKANQEPRRPNKKSNTKCLIVTCTVLVVLVLLLGIILFFLSLNCVEYYEYGISENELYSRGCYMLLPQQEMAKVTATAHHVDLTLNVTTQDLLDSTVRIMLPYFLKQDEVPDLYQRYKSDYHNVIKHVVEETLRNTLETSVTLNDFYAHRQQTEADIFEKMNFVLSGDCCPECCLTNCTREQNITCGRPHCDLNMTACSRGVHVQPRFVHLELVSFGEDVMDRNLRTVTLVIDSQKERYLQEKHILLKLIDSMNYQATIVRQNAEEKASEILQEAKDKRFKTVQAVLADKFTQLNVSLTQQEQLIDNLRALAKNEGRLSRE